MNEDILVPLGFFATVIVLALGIPMVRGWTKRREMETPRSMQLLDDRLARMETAIESMAIEIERISEAQRFVTKLLAERERAREALPGLGGTE